MENLVITFDNLVEKHKKLEKMVLDTLQKNHSYLKSRLENIEDLGGSILCHDYEQYKGSIGDKKESIKKLLLSEKYNRNKVYRLFMLREDILNKRLDVNSGVERIGTDINLLENLFHDLLIDIKVNEI